MRLGAGAADQPAAARDVVGVVMGFHDVNDAGIDGACQLEVDVDVPARVHHDRLAPVGQEVGRTAKLVIQDLVEAHAAFSSSSVENVDNQLRRQPATV